MLVGEEENNTIITPYIAQTPLSPRPNILLTSAQMSLKSSHMYSINVFHKFQVFLLWIMPSIKSRKNGHLSHFPRDAVSDFEPIKGLCLVCRVAFFVLQCFQHVRDDVIDEPEIQIMLHKFNTGVRTERMSWGGCEALSRCGRTMARFLFIPISYIPKYITNMWRRRDSMRCTDRLPTTGVVNGTYYNLLQVIFC